MKITVFLVLSCIVIFCLAGCRPKDNPGDTGMPDPNFIRTQQSVKKVNVVYGTEKAVVTLNKPDNAYFEISPAKALERNSSVSLKADDSSWRADICSTVCFDNGISDEEFAQYYYNGVLPDSQKEFELYNQEVTELGITHMNKPVKLIKSTYKKANDNQTYESYFVGFEFDDTDGKKYIGKGLMGFKIYMQDKPLSTSKLKSIFNQLFFIER